MSLIEISISKSILRIMACMWAIWGADTDRERILILALFFLLAEILGLLMHFCKKSTND